MAYEKRKTLNKEHWLRMKHDALRKRKDGNRLTLEETAVAIWNPEKEKHPMTCMGILKIEQRALQKLRIALKKYGINDLSDVIEPKYRECGKPSIVENA